MPQIIPELINTTVKFDDYSGRRFFNRLWKFSSALTRTKYLASTTYYLDEDDFLILADSNAAGGNITVYLPDAAKFANKQFVVKHIRQTGVRTVTLSAQGTNTIDGAGTYVLGTLYDKVHVISGPTNNTINWFILGT